MPLNAGVQLESDDGLFFSSKSGPRPEDPMAVRGSRLLFENQAL